MLVGSLLFEGIVNPLIDQKRQEQEQHQRNIAIAEEKARRKAEGEAFYKQQQAELAQRRKEEQELNRIEMAAMSKIYQKQRELQQKSAVADVGRVRQRQALQKNIEQQRSQTKTEMDKLAEQQRLQKAAVESQRQLSQQQRAAQDTARMRTVQQRAMAEVQKQFAPQPVGAVRRMAAPVSTASLARRGRGYNNEVLGMLQSYYGVSLKEAKKLYKSHF